MTIDTELYEAAKSANIDFKDAEARLKFMTQVIKPLVKAGGNLNMLIIGACDGGHEELAYQAFRDGACYLFSFQQAKHVVGVDVHKYGKNISMHKVDGARTKGSHDSTI